MKNLSVKLWQITMNDGSKHRVSAPSKALAKLNLFHGNYSIWGIGIKSIGIIKKEKV